MKKLLFIIIPLLIVGGIGFGTFYYVNKKIYVPTPDNFFESEEEKKEAKYNEEKGIINVLLIGVDSRGKYEDARTDSIILATLDTNNKKIKLVSFMRDMYVPIPGHGQNRINSAFFLGGPELLIKTINQDFNLNVQYYVSIDFKAFQSLVDKLGGVDVEIKDYEVKEINYYIKEANWNNPIYLEGPGFQHLNGQQALSYCRIRKVGNGDYERTERQRKILSLLADKVRKVGIVKLPDVFTSILPYVKTNIPATKLMNMAYTAYKIGSSPIQSLRVPADGMFENMVVSGMDVLVPDIEKNVNLLDKFIFSNGGTVSTNMPIYMINNFHADDKAVDKRGEKKNYVKIIIPVEETGPSLDKNLDGIIDVTNPDGNPSDNEGQGRQNEDTGTDSQGGNSDSSNPYPTDGSGESGENTPATP